MHSFLYKASSRLKCIIAVSTLVIALSVPVVAVMSPPINSMAFNITEIGTVELFSTSATPVYAAPDLYGIPVTYLDRFQRVRVNGITDNGFYRVDLGSVYYIPGPYLTDSLEAPKTEKQKALDNIKDITDAYNILLEQIADNYSNTFQLMDVTGDGVPEIIDNKNGIYTYYDKHAVMIYCTTNPIELYYSKNNNVLMGHYKWKGSDIWEVYTKDTSLLPWGQFKCYSTNASAYREKAQKITCPYSNDSSTRNDLYNKLKNILSQ